jgi:hypothetical protein
VVFHLQIQNNRALGLSRDISSFTGRSAKVSIQARNTMTGETADRTITVLITRSDKCYLNGRTCDENARCIAVEQGVREGTTTAGLGSSTTVAPDFDGQVFKCQCDADFTGDG